MKITTNNQPRDLMSFYEFSAREQVQMRSDFDWMEDLESDCSFFRYKGWIYNLSEFSRDGSPEGWDACLGDSFFSATLVRLSSDCETVIVGRCSC